jgi:ATP-binding cassette subfamily B protein
MAERIIVLDKGKVVQEGTYSELIQTDGHFRKMWQHQNVPIYDKVEA